MNDQLIFERHGQTVTVDNRPGFPPNVLRVDSLRIGDKVYVEEAGTYGTVTNFAYIMLNEPYYAWVDVGKATATYPCGGRWFQLHKIQKAGSR